MKASVAVSTRFEVEARRTAKDYRIRLLLAHIQETWEWNHLGECLRQPRAKCSVSLSCKGFACRLIARVPISQSTIRSGVGL